MMTDSQQLLVDYAKNGSETAFRELVTRYVDLVLHFITTLTYLYCPIGPVKVA